MSAAGSRCPSCAAAVRPGAQWCSLCYGALGPAQPQAAAQARPASAAHGGPPSAGGTGVDAAGDAADIEAILAVLRAESIEPLEGLAPLARAVADSLLASSGARVAVTVGGTVAAIVLLVLVMSALGALLP